MAESVKDEPVKRTVLSEKSQNRLIFLCWVVYTFSYLGRYSYSSNITHVMNHFGVSHADAGLVTTFFFFAYGAGQFINGILCKKYNKRIVFPVVLTVASLANVLVFSGVPFRFFKYIWLMNGLFQSVLWSSIVSILADNLDERHLKKSLIVLGSTTAAGTFVTYFASFIFSSLNFFKGVFLFAAVVMFSVGLIWAFTYTKTCSDIKTALPDAVIKPETANETLSSQAKFTKTMLMTVAVFALFAVVCNFLKDGLQTWVTGMLKEIYDIGDSVSILISLVLPLFSAACGIFTVLANKLIKNITLLAAVFFTITLGLAAVLKFFIGFSFVTSAILLGLIAFMSHSINTCITAILPLDFRGTGKAGLLSGILNGCCYAGSTISSYGLGSAADAFGWDSAFIIFIAVSGAAALTGYLAYLIIAKAKRP